MTSNSEQTGMWKNFDFTTNEQISLANLFKGYEDDEDLEGNDLLDTIREDFSLFSFSRLEVQVNYDIYKKVKTFLESRHVSILSSADGTQSIMVRILATVWPEETQERAESYDRYLALKRGEIDLNPSSSGITPRQAQRASLLPILNVATGTEQPDLPRALQSAYRPAEMMQTTASASHRSEVTQTSPFSKHPATEQRNLRETHTASSDVASKVMSRYNQDRQRFGGSTQDNWTIALAKYDRMASELGMSPGQKLQLIHHMFRDDAEHFYYDELQEVRSWEEMVSILDKRYNGPARQQSIIDELRTMTIQDFSNSTEHEGQSLQKLARRIERLVPQCQPGRNGDRDKRDALYYAVRSCEWSSGPITSLSTFAGKPYKQFLDELATAEQNHRIAGNLKGKLSRHGRAFRQPQTLSPPTTTRAAEGTPNSASIWFAGQARYGRDPRARKTPNVTTRYDRRCYNCNSTDHIVNKCSLPLDDVRIMGNRIKQLTRGKDQKFIEKVLKKMLLEQSAHINFLSERLIESMNVNDDIFDTDTVSSSEDVLEAQHELDNDNTTSPLFMAAVAPRDTNPSLANALEEDIEEQDFL